MSEKPTAEKDSPSTTPPAKQSQESVQELKQQLAENKSRLEEYLNGWKRAKADYDNLKKETEQRQKELIQFATMGFIMELIPILNNFKRALSHIPEDRQKHPEIAGFELIKKQLETTLESAGVQSIPTENHRFDPRLHEALAHEERPGMEEGMIIEELQPGYMMHDRVIEPAKVKIVKNQNGEQKDIEK